MANKMKKKVVLIAGMHRSGTSMMARLLNLHGIHLPLEEEYKDEFNEKGYWENLELVNISNEILRLGESFWFDPRAFEFSRHFTPEVRERVEQRIREFTDRELTEESPVFVIKDPRICRLIPVWRSALEGSDVQPTAIISYRQPLEVAASLKNRDGFSTEFCLSLWLRNVLEAEYATRGLTRVFCAYEEVLSDWPMVIGKISQSLDLPLSKSSNQVQDQVSEFVSNSLRHWSFSDADLENFDGSNGLAHRTFQLLREAETGESPDLLARFDRVREEFDWVHIISIEQELQDRIQKQKYLEELKANLARSESQVSVLKNEVLTKSSQMHAQRNEMLALEVHSQNLQNGLQAVHNSLSWIITWPVRFLVQCLLAGPKALFAFPGMIASRIRAARALPELVQLEADSRLYVPASSDKPPESLPLKLIAFYLPQFHRIPENDEWWGEGFTEWTNVKPAKPQFKGQYQPRVPGELGYYDLSDIEVQRRQIELARQYGLGGFCFYFYWFHGERLLEAPVLQYLENKDLDFPFCLCWANENWSRTWDGLDDHVLIGQEHSEEDDEAFIQYLSRYLVDERYIRVNGKPLVLVYRPNLLPDPEMTAASWRRWCRANGVGEIFLAYTQSFDAVDPETYGFDAAIEFPPNITGPNILTEEIKTVEGFSGEIYDWPSVASRSQHYKLPKYMLFRGVNPCWDNTARRDNTAGIFIGSTPEAYENWLENAARDTLQRFKSDSERLVFVNAWNEWAEGAYLEPDEAYGYAYLQATRNAMVNTANYQPVNRIILVAHDAHPHGAQYLSMFLAKTLNSVFGFHVELVVLGDGVLLSEYGKWADVHSLHGLSPTGIEAVQLAESLGAKGCRTAICNTTVSGSFLQTLSEAGIECISLIHELKQVILDNHLHLQAMALAEHASRVVFPAQQVMDAFQEVAEVSDDKAVIRFQGLYKNNEWVGRNEQARLLLRKELDLSKKSRVVLGVGFLDHRKGVDLFVDAGLKALDVNRDVYFVWIGHWESGMEVQIRQRLENEEFASRFIFPGRKKNTDLYYAGADVFVLSSREDPFPTTVLEALEVGVPVIGFWGAGGFENLLREDCGILVPLEDVDGLAEAITSLVEDHEKAKTLGDHGAELVKERYSFRHYVHDLLELLGQQPMKISVVVPNYNYARYLNERLESIFSQTYPVYEVIVLDDASTDNSIEIIEECFRQTGIDCRLLVNQENSGSVSKQWSKAVEAARGDYIWICEADDTASPTFLEKVLPTFDDPDVVVGYSQSSQIDEDGNVIEDNYLKYTDEIFADHWLQDYVAEGEAELSNVLAIKNTIPNVSAVVFRRSALASSMAKNMDLLQKLKVAGDWLIYSDLLQEGKIAFIAEALNAHRRHQNSVTIDTANNMRHMAEILYMQKRISEVVDISESTRKKCKSFEQHALEYLEIAELAGEDSSEGKDVSYWLKQLLRINNYEQRANTYIPGQGLLPHLRG
jgi:glycosyltransferase involved in cell wall biosynthesis